MIAILKQRHTEGVVYQIDDPAAYERAAAALGSHMPLVNYRVFVDTETERRYREQMGDLDAQIEAFFGLGEHGPAKVSIRELPAAPPAP